MSSEKSPAVLCKIIIVIVGFVLLVLGCVSHFKSSWVSFTIDDDYYDTINIGLYKICFQDIDLNCPDISLERFFVAVIIICFVLSVCLLAATFFSDSALPHLKTLDIAYHVVGAILLLAGAIVYIISAEQINDMVDTNKDNFGLNFRRPEKLAAGVLAILQSVLHVVTMYLIVKN